MKKVILFLTISSFLSFAALHASPDSVIPGASSTNGNTLNQLISVGKTQMQIGAAGRAHANYINQSSGAAIPRNDTRGTRADRSLVLLKLKMFGNHGKQQKMQEMLLA